MQSPKGPLFFDTSAFNAALDSVEKYEGGIIASCPQVLAELAATFEKDPDRAKSLCNTFSKLVGPRLVRPAPELAGLEALNLSNERTLPFVYFDNNRLKSFVGPRLEALCSGKYHESDMKEFVGKIGPDKGQFLKSIKSEVDINEPEPAETFNEMLAQLPEGHLIIALRNTLERFNIMTSNANCRFVLENRLRFPHIYTFSVIPYALSYLYRTQKTVKPKWGINYDMSIIVNSSSFNIFVTGDGDARALYRVLFPEKAVLSYKDLVDRQRLTRSN